jgi:hypothetical protein
MSLQAIGWRGLTQFRDRPEQFGCNFPEHDVCFLAQADIPQKTSSAIQAPLWLHSVARSRKDRWGDERLLPT